MISIGYEKEENVINKVLLEGMFRLINLKERYTEWLTKMFQLFIDL